MTPHWKGREVVKISVTTCDVDGGWGGLCCDVTQAFLLPTNRRNLAGTVLSVLV